MEALIATAIIVVLMIGYTALMLYVEGAIGKEPGATRRSRRYTKMPGRNWQHWRRWCRRSRSYRHRTICSKVGASKVSKVCGDCEHLEDRYCDADYPAWVGDGNPMISSKDKMAEICLCFKIKEDPS